MAAYPYMYFPEYPLAGSYTSKKISIAKTSGYWAFDKKSSNTGYFYIDETMYTLPTTYYTNNRFVVSEWFTSWTLHLTNPCAMWVSGLSSSSDSNVIEMLKASKFYWYKNDSGTLPAVYVDLTYLISSVTWDSNQFAYKVIFDFTQVTDADKQTIISTDTSLRFAYFIGLTSSTPTTKFTITENLSNITSDSGNVKEVAENDTFTLTYTANTGYTISSFTSNIGDITISADSTTATVTGTATANITITGTATAETKKHYVYISGTINNATCNYNNGETVSAGKQFKIIANDGYSFTTAGTYIRNEITYTLNISDDNKTLYVDLSADYDYYFNDTYSAKQDTISASKFTNLYLVDDVTLNKLAKKRIVTGETESTDYGNFITSLYIMPIELPDTVIGDTDKIILGNYNTQIETTVLNNYTLLYDLGAITVPEKYNNAYDYINTRITLYLPFFGGILLTADDVINKTINITFTFDLYSGNCTVQVLNDNNDVIYNQNSNIVTQIPFIQQSTNSVINTLSITHFNDITVPYIVVRRNKPYNAINSTFGATVYEQGNISDFSGYTVFENVKIETIATEQEKTLIEQLLKSGVYINND